MTITYTTAILSLAALAVGFGLGWLSAKARSMSDYNAMYSQLTCEIVSRMTKACRTLCIDQDTIDRVVERMGSKLVWAIPNMPPPPIPAARDETSYEVCDGEGNWLTLDFRGNIPEEERELLRGLARRSAKMINRYTRENDREAIEKICDRLAEDWRVFSTQHYRNRGVGISSQPLMSKREPMVIFDAAGGGFTD